MTTLVKNILLKILWKRGEIAPQEQFLLFSTIFCDLILNFCVKTRTRFSLRDKRLFEITEVEITRVDCICTMVKYWSQVLRSTILTLLSDPDVQIMDLENRSFRFFFVVLV